MLTEVILKLTESCGGLIVYAVPGTQSRPDSTQQYRARGVIDVKNRIPWIDFFSVLLEIKQPGDVVEAIIKCCTDELDLLGELVLLLAVLRVKHRHSFAGLCLPGAAVQIIARQIRLVVTIGSDGFDLHVFVVPHERQVVSRNFSGLYIVAVQVKLFHPLVRFHYR